MGIISHAMVSKWEEMGVLDELKKEKEVEKIKEELDRTRKALDVAIETLRDIKNDPNTNDENTELLAYRLEQINEITKGGK